MEEPAAHPDRPSESTLLTRRLFLAALGLVFGIAFLSLWVQVDGLMGSRGILPAARFLDQVHDRLGSAAYARAPTLCWLGCSDRVLQALCGAGVALSVLLVVGVAPSLVLLALWASYLSLTVISGVFLSYQWDVLLLEAGFVAIFLAPRQLRPRDALRTRVSPASLFLLRWLVARLYFMSGAVKLLSGDPTWRNLSALEFHYFTQPIPSWTSYWVHHLPALLHALSCAAILVIEIGAPLLVFGPRRLRLLACGLIAGTQLLILATGNFAFFNLLTLALCVPLLDDRALRALAPPPLRRRLPAPPAEPGPPTRAGRVMMGVVVTLVVGITTVRTLERFGMRPPLPAPARAVMKHTAPFRTFNAYGLFAVMTTHRDEIIVEGSLDGERWLAYEFPYKPGRLDRMPRFVAPHQPRLDWQMWFAALQSCDTNAWFIRFQVQLMRGSPAVRALLEHDPFPDEPPRFIRSTLYRYRFTRPAERSTSGSVWERRELGAYCVDLMLTPNGVTRAPT